MFFGTKNIIILRGKMLQEISLIIFISTTMMPSVPCFGFTAQRTENAPVTGNAMSTFIIERKVTLNHTPSMKTEAKNADRNLQISDAKFTKAVEQISPVDPMIRSRKFDFTLENAESDPRSTKMKEVNLGKENGVIGNGGSSPRNIIMVVTELTQGQAESLTGVRDFHLFTEGTLQSCNSSQVEETRFSLDDALVSGSKMRKHDCEHLLRSNIATLLLWARDVKGMTTGTLSNANFTIPSLFGYEESVGLSKDFDELDENNMRPIIHNLKPEVRGDWHVIDLGKPSTGGPLMPLPNNREDDDAAWKVFDMFSKIRLVLFRSLLESLGGNIAASEDSIASRKSRVLRPNLVDMVEELKSVENEKGFILVASVPNTEFTSALEVLQREAAQDTLLVITGVCSHDTKPIPFFAQGPSAKMLREAVTIWDVPIVLKNIIASECRDSSCRTRRHDVFPPSVLPIKMADPGTGIFKRSVRGAAEKMDDARKVNASPVKEVHTTGVSTKKVEVSSNPNVEESKVSMQEVKPKQVRSNSGNINVAEKFTTIFGTVVSMAVAFSLTG